MIVKKLIPKKVKVSLKLLKIYSYDFSRFIKYSNAFQTFNTENKLKGKLTIYYHVLEKGLTMPETRLGFGKPVITELMKMVNMYLDKGYDRKSLEFVHSLNVVNEYLEFHLNEFFKLDDEILEEASKLNSRVERYETQKQYDFHRDTYFSHSKSSFEKFCLSRFSSRNYTSEVIPQKILNNCIRLALKTPTSCNRQVNRVHMIRSKELKDEVLKLQYGNRGFGHLADTLLIITADISVFQGTNDRNESYINSGMFAMSLLYALHHYEIGACPLNWSVEMERDKALRKLLNIPNNERVGLVISCGYLPERIRIASSPRLNETEIITVY